MNGPSAPSDDDGGDNEDHFAAETAAAGSQRLDKWLWFARVIKTRTLAAGLVTDGRVRLNTVKIAKPSQPVKAGDVLTISVGDRVRVLKVVSFGIRRGPAGEAQLLFEDLTPPPPPRAERPPEAGGQREAGSGRPTKRDRRLLDRLTGDGSQ
ncbi:MAG: RNA-binding S4 domain-containing protein [Hyphomicrobiaceae bacterium]